MQEDINLLKEKKVWKLVRLGKYHRDIKKKVVYDVKYYDQENLIR